MYKLIKNNWNIIKLIKKNIFKLKFGIKRLSGRSRKGKITVYHRGNANKKNYYIVDFVRNINNYGYIISKIYDNYRKLFLNLICYNNGIILYNLKIINVNIGTRIYTGKKNILNFFIGSSSLIKYLKSGDFISLIELKKNTKAKIIRASGLYSIFLYKKNDIYFIKLKSGVIIKINENCMITKGKIFNNNKLLLKKKKAGINRILGWKSIVRGVAMNSKDHPHGGNTSGGRPCVTPWGKLTKGKKTTKNNKKKYRFNF